MANKVAILVWLAGDRGRSQTLGIFVSSGIIAGLWDHNGRLFHVGDEQMCLRQALRPLILYTDPRESNASKVTLLGRVKVKVLVWFQVQDSLCYSGLLKNLLSPVNTDEAAAS